MAESGATRNLLAVSLHQLMLTKPLSSITVGDICTEAGMNRKSFYYHFRDKFDLVNWMLYTSLTEHILSNPDTDVLVVLCNLLAEDPVFWKAAMKPDGQNSCQEYLLEVLRPMMAEYMATRGDPLYRSFYTDSLTALWQQAVIRWVKAGCDLPPVRFVKMIYQTGTFLKDMEDSMM